MQKELNMIKELLVDLSKYIEIENSNEEYAINKIAENILIGVFNILFDCDLKNMGYIKKNYPAIDLADSARKISIQVTTSNRFTKIEQTLEKIKKQKRYLEYKDIYIFVITKEKSYQLTQEKIDRITEPEYNFPLKNIIDITNLYTILNQNNDLDQIKEIREYLEKHLRLDQNQPENASKEKTRQNAIHIFLSGNKKLIIIILFLSIITVGIFLQNRKNVPNKTENIVPPASDINTEFNTHLLLELSNANHQYEMGLQDWRRLDYKRAEKNILAARDNISSQIAQSDLELAKINNSLGCLYLDMGKYESAYDFLNSALAAFQPAYDANNIEIRAVMFSIAQYDYYTGNFERARKTAQDIIDNSNTKTDKVVITSISHFIAMIYDSLGKYDSAISMYKDVLSLYDDIAEDKELSKNLADYANDPHLSQDEKEDKTNAIKWIILTYNNMGQVYTHLKKYDSACSALQTGLGVSLDNIYIGRENLTASKLYMNLAVADANLGNIKEALDNIDLAMRIQKKLFNYEGSYPGLVEVYNTYATLLMKNNDYANAKNYLKKEIELAKTTFGENHPLTAEAYNTFSIYWYKCGNYEKAASSADKAITIRKNILGKEHPTTVNYYINLSKAQTQLKKDTEASASLAKAKEICDKLKMTVSLP